jgi:hypothetical protein
MRRRHIDMKAGRLDLNPEIESRRIVIDRIRRLSIVSKRSGVRLQTGSGIVLRSAVAGHWRLPSHVSPCEDEGKLTLRVNPCRPGLPAGAAHRGHGGIRNWDWRLSLNRRILSWGSVEQETAT